MQHMLKIKIYISLKCFKVPVRVNSTSKNANKEKPYSIVVEENALSTSWEMGRLVF